MASTYSVRELYGGAIAVELPTELIDSRYVLFQTFDCCDEVVRHTSKTWPDFVQWHDIFQLLQLRDVMPMGVERTDCIQVGEHATSSISASVSPLEQSCGLTSSVAHLHVLTPIQIM